MKNICKVSRSTITFWKHLSGLFLLEEFSLEKKKKTSVSLFSILKKKAGWERGGSYGIKNKKKKSRAFKGETLPVSCQDDNGKNEIDILTQIIC